MMTNWNRNVLAIVSMMSAAACSAALADHHGGNFGGAIHTMQGSGNSGVARSIGSQSFGNNGLNSFKPQIKLPTGNFGQLNGNQHSLGVTPKLNGINLGTQLQNKPTIKIGNLNGQGGSQGWNSQVLNSNNVKKIGNTILGNQSNKFGPSFNNKCLPGCFPGGCYPCKIGCYPWWWNSYSWCYPSYKVCYPVIYTQPIVYTVPAVTEVATVSAVAEEKLLQVPAGATLTLQAQDLGPTAGQVVLHIDTLAMPAMVNEWKNDSVTATLPPMGVASPIKGEILLVKADGKVANSVKIELIAAQPENGSGAAPAAGTVQ